MFAAVLFYVFMFIGLFNLAHIGLYLIGANAYDVREYKRRKRKSERTRRAPTVTVLIPAHNEEMGVIRTIESVKKSTVRSLEIIVIDDASTDNTYDIVADYIRKNPDFNYQVKLLRCVKNVGKAGALNYALNRGIKSEFVMTLDADSILHPKAIENATDYLIDDPHVAGVAANVRVTNDHSILGLVQRFEYLVGYRSKKFYTMSNSEFIVGGVGSTYRYSVLKQVGFYDHDVQTEDIALSLKVASLGNRNYRLVYGADVVAMTEGVQTFKQLLRQRYRWKLGSLQALFRYRQLALKMDKRFSRSLTMYRLPVAFLGELIVLVEPFILAFVMYLSFLYLSPQSFAGAYALISLYLLWNIWPDEHMKFREKLRMTALTPFMYFLFYIMNVVQFWAIMQCLLHYKKITGKEATSATWKSPERSGGSIAFS